MRAHGMEVRARDAGFLLSDRNRPSRGGVHAGILFSQTMSVRAGFSLVEMLISVSIIGVLIAISIPVLMSVRRDATTTACMAQLRSIGQIYESYAADRTGLWPNIWEATELGYVMIPAWGNMGHDILPIDQIEFWGYDFRGYVGDGSADAFAKAFSCPIVYPAMLEAHADFPSIVPAGFASRSFLYSPALFTSASAWNDRNVHPDVNVIVADVRHSDVVFPSSKSVLVERASRHAQRNVSLLNASYEPFNVLAADGHVEHRSPDESETPHRFTGRSLDNWLYFPWTEAPAPFLGTHRGSLGRDW